tara:strand:- start:1320 stop:1508 length:189 start_codon:yes stop_codon:yes gene_type:complete
MIRNIRHIQIKKIAYHPKLYQAVITFEKTNNEYDESDDIEYIKLRDLKKRETIKARDENNNL